jgi:hypothetical protein
VELWIDDAWVDITSDVYTRAPITITRGRSAEGGQVEPSECRLTVNNRDGAYTPRNPTGDYFGKIGRNTPARVSVGADTRLVGEVAGWPTRWDKPGKDVYAPLEVAGIMRRLGQGNAPAPSAPRRYILTTSPSAYWPLEDGPQTVQAGAAPGVGGGPVKLVGRPAPSVWGQGALASWLPGVAKIEPKDAGSTLQAAVSQPDFVDTWTFDFMRSGGYGATAGNTVFGIRWGGSSVEADLESTGITFDAADSEIDLTVGFSTLATEAVDPSLWDDNPHHVRLTATQDGTAIDYQVWIDGVSVLTVTDAGETLEQAQSAQATVSITTETAMATGHWAVYTDPPALADAVAAAFGHPGEAAGRRIERLCDEQGIPFVGVGDLDDTAPMGPQASRPPLELLLEAADTDYSADVFHGLPEPVDEDRFTRNDVTAKRPNSGEARAVLDTGALSTADPPDGVGTYDTSVTVNAAGDGLLADHAGWLLGLGTVDEARYPRLPFRLNAVPGIAADIAGLDLGDMVRITDLPSWLPPDDVDVLVVGTVETLESHMRDIELVTAPAAPYRVGIYGDTVGDDPSKYDTASTIRPLNYSAITTTQTLITFETLIGPPWTEDDDEFPFDIYVDGERMTVTDIAGTAFGPLEQSFTVVRSVNGVVKGHAIGTPIRLWNPARYGL